MKIEIIVGTTLGAAEYVADELLAELETDHQVAIHLNPSFADLDQQALWLVCSSTHGAGEVPDNLKPLLHALEEEQHDLKGLNYAVVGIGSRSYDRFCQAGITIDHVLAQLGANRIQERLDIDVNETPVPEEPAVAWLQEWKERLLK